MGASSSVLPPTAVRTIAVPSTESRSVLVAPGFALVLLALKSGCSRAALVHRRLRLVGKEVPRNKEIAWALMCAIFGIGKTTSFQICKDTGIDPHKRTYELSE